MEALGINLGYLVSQIVNFTLLAVLLYLVAYKPIMRMQGIVAIENGAPALRTRIIVGTPWNPTPLVDTYTTAVRFRPSWRPTPEMVASGEYEDRVWPPGPDEQKRSIRRSFSSTSISISRPARRRSSAIKSSGP